MCITQYWLKLGLIVQIKCNFYMLSHMKENLRPSSYCNEPITMRGGRNTVLCQQTLKQEKPSV